MSKTVKILLIEDDPEDYRIFKTYLQSIKRTNFEIDQVFKYEESLNAILKKEHDVYLMDYYLGNGNGLELLKNAVEKGFDLPVIFLTGRKNSDTDLEALKYGAYDYLVKDYINPESLERSIRYALSRFELEYKLKEQKVILEAIIENSPVGMCVTSEDLLIKNYNDQFLEMFSIKENILDLKINEVIYVEKKSEDIYSKKYDPISFPFLNINQEKMISFEGKVVSKEKKVYCIVKSKEIIIKNGKEKKYNLFIFVNANQYKEREDRLRDTIEYAEELVKKYAETNKDPGAYIDLADLEITKMSHGINMSSSEDQ